MDTDLHKVITSRQVLEEEHHRYFVYQILLGINYIHSANLVHRDLKPANVLVNKNCDVKVCDFGLARAGCFDPNSNLTDYVVTRWWRAPEVVLLPSAYTEKVDVWAIGCILAELMGRTPLFKGKDHLDQVKKIFSVTGRPAEADLAWLPPKPHPAWGFVARLDACPKKPWGMIYPNASQSAIDTLEAMLCVNPWQRASAKEAMFLEYFQPLYMEGDVQDAESQIYCEIDRMEPVTLTKHFLQNSMYAEICKMHPEMMQARVIQLHPSLVAADGTLAVHCHGIGGDEIATIVTEPGQDIGALRAKLSMHLDEPMDFLQLLKANDRLLNRCDAEEHLAVVIALDARIASAA